jgi:hypothetical protein
MTVHRPLLLLAAALLPACAGPNTVSKADLRSAFDVQYGIVDTVEAAEVESSAGSAAVMGGVVGAVAVRKNRLAGAAGGAVGGALLAALLEGNRKAFAYTVRLDAGRTVKVIVDHGDLKAGQCVAVEQGRSANVRGVSPGHCHADGQVASRSLEVQQGAQADAGACHDAKEAVLAAQTADQLQLAEQKARILCGH